MNRCLAFTLLVLFASLLIAYIGIEDLDGPTYDTLFTTLPLTLTMGTRTAYVLGASGGAGGGIIKALAAHPQFTHVTIFGRRPVKLPEDPNYSKFVQKAIDFDNLTKHEQDFVGFDVGFCALGVRSGTPNYYKITHDYVADTAQLALRGGCKHFHVITGQGTNVNSWFEWARIKGKLEQTVSGMDFERVSIYRPAAILVDKENPAVHERILQPLFKCLDRWRLISVYTDVLGEAMVKNTFRQTDKKVEVLENGDINRLFKEFKSSG